MKSDALTVKTLGEICVDNKGTYGIAASAVDYNDELYTYLRITDINDDGTLNYKDLKSVDDQNSYKYILKENDIVFARTGNSTGRSYFYDKRDGEFVYAGFLIKFGINPDIINPWYMKYYTKSTLYKNWVDSFNSGSTRGNINAQTYSKMPVYFPGREIQDKLVYFLNLIDDKIKTNNKLNDNLEEITEILFEQWFYKFEFFTEKEGTYKSSGGEFKDTTLGEIPMDFETGKMQQIIKFSNGKKRPDETGTTPLYGGNGILDWVESSNYKNLIIIGRVGAYCGSLYIEPGRCWISDNAIAAIPKQSKNYYAYLLLKKYNLNNMHIGSSQPLLTQGILNSIEVVVPKETVINKFNDMIEPIYRKIFQNRAENERLVLLRDTLIPKLMTGQIELDNLDMEI